MGRVNCVTGAGGVDFKIFTGVTPPEAQPEGLFVPIPGYTKLAITPISLGAGDVVVADEISNLPTRRNVAYATYDDGKLYWVNQAAGSGSQGSTRTVTFIIDIYDIESDLYTSVTHTTASEYFSALSGFGIYNHRMIFAGGYYLSSSGTEWLRSVRAGLLDLSTNLSNRIADMTEALTQMGTAAGSQGLFYFYGGENGSSNSKSRILRRYDSISNLWTNFTNTTTSYAYAIQGYLLNINDNIFYIGYAATSSTGTVSTTLNNTNMLFNINNTSFSNISFSGVNGSLNSSVVQFPSTAENSVFIIAGNTVSNMFLIQMHLETAIQETMLPASSIITDPMRVLLGSSSSLPTASRPALLAATIPHVLVFHSQRETNSNHDASKLLLIGEPSDIGTLVINKKLSYPNVVLSDTPSFYLKTGVKGVYYSPTGTLIPVTGIKRRTYGEDWVDL